MPDKPKEVTVEIDPVCGREVGSDSEFSSEYNGETYYFCSAMDQAVFDEHPEEYGLKDPVLYGRREREEGLNKYSWQDVAAERESKPHSTTEKAQPGGKPGKK